MKKVNGISKKEAITAYVLHLMMWDELSHSGHDTKNGSITVKDHKAHTCEFCYIDRKNSDDQYGGCQNCPADLSKLPQRNICLGGMYDAWCGESSERKRKIAATKIRDVELADWFKKLIS